VSDYQPPAPGGWPAQPAAGNPGQDGYGSGGSGQPPRRRRRRHPFIVIVVVLVVLVVIAVIGDQVAKSYAQNRVAQQVQQSSQMSAKPSVSIKGWPFLTQVLSHDLKQVDISASNVTANGSKVHFSFSATATGVHLNSSFNGGTADQINGQAVLPFSSVASLVPGGSAATITADPADGPNAVKVDLGALGSITGEIKLTSPSQIALQLSSASGFASLFSGLSGNAVDIAIPQLPAGLVVQSVSVTSAGIVATASASNTTLTQ
jgi:hypothetical protein